MIDHLTKFDVKPSIDVQLLGINKNYLILQQPGLRLRLGFGWIGSWLFWVLGLPMLIYLFVAPWLPPYGYRDGVEIASFSEKISGYPIIETVAQLFFSMILGAPGIVMSLGFAFINLKRLKTDYPPIVFDRKSKIITIGTNTKSVSVNWSDVDVSIRTVFYASGFVPHQMKVLCLSNLGENTLIEGGIVADSLDGKAHDSVEATWEYIRQFMVDGPDALNVPALKFEGLSNLDKQPLYSYSFPESVSNHWFWPIFKELDRHPFTIILTLLFWPMKVLFFIPNILADWLWRKISLSVLSASSNTPYYLFSKYDELITSEDAVTSLQAQEDLIDGVNFLDVQQRINKS